VEQAVDDGGAAGVGEQFALISRSGPRGGAHRNTQPQTMTAGGAHLDHLGLAPPPHLLHDDTGVLLVDVDHNLLSIGSLPLAGGFVLLQDDAGTRYRQFKSLRAAWSRSGSRACNFAAARDFPSNLCSAAFGDPQRDIAFGLGAAGRSRIMRLGHLGRPSVPARRRVVDDETTSIRSADRSAAPSNGVSTEGSQKRIGDGTLGEAGNGDDVRRLRPLSSGVRLDTAETR